MDISLQTLAAAVMRSKMDHKPAKLSKLPDTPLHTAQEVQPEKLVSIYLIRTPNSGMKGLVRIRQQLDLAISIGELLNKAQNLPVILLEGVSLTTYQARCLEIITAENCIEVADTTSLEIIDID